MTGEPITRRDFMRQAGALSAGIALGACAAPSAGEAARDDSRPNILFVIADDWSYPHAGVYGDSVSRTPAFDKIASEGVLFTNAFCASPSCTPSRGAILTGQAIHRLEEGAHLHSILRPKFAVYPELLQNAGYTVGFTGKGWSPGSVKQSGRKENPAGPKFAGFAKFLKTVPAGKPFCFWFGSVNPHRPYEKGSGAASGLRPEQVKVPPFLPDTPEVRGDILDYYREVQLFDEQVAGLMKQLEESGRARNTILVVTSDNGMPFPRAKTNLYDCGTHMPLAIRWPAKAKAGCKVDDFVSFTDFAPTFLEAAGLKPLPAMTGDSFLDTLISGKSRGDDAVYLERERHTNCRPNNGSYPMRAIRTKDHLYVRNLRPDRWPVGDPGGDRPYADIDASPSKDIVTAGKDDKSIATFYKLACAKRPSEELYDLAKDSWQLTNVADDPAYADAKRKLSAQLLKWMTDTRDPRALHDDDRWDAYPIARD